MYPSTHIHIYLLFGNRESKADREVRDFGKIQTVLCYVSGDVRHPSPEKTSVF